jgi:competence protein ComFC
MFFRSFLFFKNIFLHFLNNFIFINECVYCFGKKSFFDKVNKSLCDKCFDNIIPIVPIEINKKINKVPVKIYSLGKYDGVLKYIIGSKYRKNNILYKDIAYKIADCFLKHKLKADCFITIPQHSIRRSLRFINQTEEIANNLSKILKIPVFSEILPIKYSKPQAFLSIFERSINNKDRFYILEKNRIELKNKDIFIIDDVYTTGATINAIIEVLEKLELKSCNVFVISRTE